MKIKLENGPEIELPAGFESLDQFIAKYNEAAQRASELQTAQAQLDKFKQWGDPETLEARLQAHIQQQVEQAKAAAKAEGATKKEVTAAGNEVWDRWAELTPQQQVQFMTEQVANQVNQQVTAKVEDYWKQAQTQLQSALKNQQDSSDLVTRAIDLKLRYPNVDLPKVWQNMTEYAKATPDRLMQMGFEKATEDERWEAKLKEERAKWEEAQSKKEQADKLSVLNSDTTAQWLDRTKRQDDRPSLKEPGGDEKLRDYILRSALEKGEIRPENI